MLALGFFFLSGTEAAYVDSTNILADPLRVRNMLLNSSSLKDPLLPFTNPYCIPQKERHISPEQCSAAAVLTAEGLQSPKASQSSLHVTKGKISSSSVYWSKKSNMKVLFPTC